MSSGDIDNLLSDFTRFYILDILYERPAHGYGIISKYRRRVGKSISPSLVYPFLKQLQDKGLVVNSSEMVGEKERKVYELTEEGRALSVRLFKRFASLISTALEPSMDVCAHCGCKVFDGKHVEEMDGVETSFCCVHCASAFHEERLGTITGKEVTL
jgi:DNA-binding PadR family transcriptional regulator